MVTVLQSSSWVESSEPLYPWSLQTCFQKRQIWKQYNNSSKSPVKSLRQILIRDMPPSSCLSLREGTKCMFLTETKLLQSSRRVPQPHTRFKVIQRKYAEIECSQQRYHQKMQKWMHQLHHYPNHHRRKLSLHQHQTPLQAMSQDLVAWWRHQQNLRNNREMFCTFQYCLQNSFGSFVYLKHFRTFLYKVISKPSLRLSAMKGRCSIIMSLCVPLPC